MSPKHKATVVVPQAQSCHVIAQIWSFVPDVPSDNSNEKHAKLTSFANTDRRWTRKATAWDPNNRKQPPPSCHHGSAPALCQRSLPSPGPVRLILEATKEIGFPPFAFASADAATSGHQTSLASEHHPPTEVHVQRQVPGPEGQV